MNKIDPKKLSNRIKYLEENRRYIQNALEFSLESENLFSDSEKKCSPSYYLQKAEMRINHLILFDAHSIYLISDDNLDFYMATCDGFEYKDFIEKEVEFFIENGIFAASLRENRGFIVDSEDHSRRLLMHVISTHYRIRGIFIGVLPVDKNVIADTSLTLLSFILKNTASDLEVLQLYHFMKEKNVI